MTMGFLQRLLGKPESAARTQRELAAEHVQTEADDLDLVEFEIVGESHRQPELEALAGPKEIDGKEVLVGVTLRCEPDNEYDGNAVRVEVMGQHLGYVARDQAVALSPAMQNGCGGALEARGLIVGGWRDSRSEGHYGIRVWVSGREAQRLGVQLVSTPVDSPPRVPPPSLPDAGTNERRLSPTQADVDAGRWGSTVTVVAEEHYQQTLLGALPDGWEDHWCPVLVDLAIAECNPHSRHTTPCVEVRIGGETVGFLTPKMTARYEGLVRGPLEQGKRPTAVAHAHVATKAGANVWRLKVVLPRE
jgi:HIRAN domain